MAIEVEEQFASRAVDLGNDPSAELRFLIKGTDDDQVARIALRDETGALFDIWGDATVQLWRERAYIERIGPELWEGVVRYSRSQKALPTDGSSYSFDTTGGTQHITQSLQTIARKAKAGQTAPDNYGAIGVTLDGVEGVDIGHAAYSWQEIYVFPQAAITAQYKAALYYMTYTVNSQAFRGLAAGECLYRGATGQSRGNTDVELTFNFSASPNATGLVVGDLQPIDKKGWEYLWIRYGDFEDQKEIVKRPIAVYVEKVYVSTDFVNLGIGTD